MQVSLSIGFRSLPIRFATAVLCLLASVAWVSATAELESEELTIVQPMDVQAWIRDSAGLREQLLGSWSHNSEHAFEIYAFPLAENAVLVSLLKRMVPGFLTEVEGESFLVLGDQASEQLELMPRVFQIVNTDAPVSVRLMEVVSPRSREAFATPEALKQWLEREAGSASRMPYERNS